jgi:uncharacterized protein
MLRAACHQVIRIVRRAAGDDEVQWNPSSGTIDGRELEGIEAVVHLAGAGVGDRRWSTDYKRLILSSRIDATATLVKALTLLPTPPSVLLSASAVGYYGMRRRGTDRVFGCWSGIPG